MVEADWASVGAGESNRAISKWTAITGGFRNEASGKFAAVAGGSNNVAGGRYAVSLGKSGAASQDHSLCLSFNNQDCVVSGTKTVQISAGVVSVNGYSLATLVDTHAVSSFEGKNNASDIDGS